MIERLYVNNFRCLENFSLDLADRASALVIGKNGSGKSTLLQAFGVFQSICRGASRMRELIAENDFTQHRTHLPMRFEIELRLGDNRFKYGISFEMPVSFHEARIADEALSVNGTDIFTRRQAQVTLAGGAEFGLDGQVAALPVINERPGESSITRIRSYFASMVLIAPIPGNMSGFSEEESVELHRDAGNVSAWLNALLLRQPAVYNHVFSYLKSALPDLLAFENVPRGETGKQLRIQFGQNGSGVLSIDFRQLSDGEKCLFLCALIMAANKVNPVFCMWDEPDSHLSLPEIGQFVTHLRKLTNENGQFIATSHHPETIRRFSDDSTLVFTRKSHLEPTIVRSLSGFPYSGDLIEALVRDDELQRMDQAIKPMLFP